MSIIDIVVIIIWLFFAIRGFLRGFASEIAMIVSLLAGFYGANAVYHMLIPFVADGLQSVGPEMTTYTGVISYCIAFLGILLLALILMAAMAKAIHFSIFTLADSALGAVAGLLKGTILTAVLCILVTTFLPGESILKASRLLALQAPVTLLVRQAIPQNMLDRLQSLLPKPALHEKSFGSRIQ